MRAKVIIVGILAGIWQTSAMAQPGGNDPEKMLERVPRLEAKQARSVLQRALRTLAAEGKELSDADRERLTPKLIEAFRKVARTPADLKSLLPEKASASVARQVSYRRYREQWLLDAPVRLLLVFDCPQGEQPALTLVRSLAAE